MAIDKMDNEEIVTGKKLRRFVNGAWERISFWHKASDCVFNDGMNAQDKLGDIIGITTSTDVNKTGYAADAKVVSDIYQNLTVPQLDGQPFIFDYQNGKFGYNIDPERGSDTFSTFSQIDNMKNVKITYDKAIQNMWYEFDDIITTSNIVVKLILKDNIHYGDTISLSMWCKHGITAQGFSYKIPVVNDTNNSAGYKTELLYGNIFIIKFFFPYFANVYLGKSISSFTLINCTNSEAEMLEVSVLTGDSKKDRTWYGIPQIDAYNDFKFNIKTLNDNKLLSINSDGIYHIGLSTSSTGSNLVWVDGSFMRKTSSSKRYKNSIHTLSNRNVELSPEKLYDIDVVTFKYNDDYLNASDQRYNTDIPGFIAEDVYEKYPIACNLDNEGRPEMWDINIMFPAALQLIQNQHKDIEELKKEIASLKATNYHQ